MKTIIYVGSQRSTMPELSSLDGAVAASADIIIVMNRPCTQAAVVKHRWANTGVAAVIYQPEGGK